MRVKRDGSGTEVETIPLAGTRPRGDCRETDLIYEEELLKDRKERAEHVMLVDLGRNDIGRVAVPGSVKVKDFFSVERYSHVMHIASRVVGQLAKGKDAVDALVATFPAGTLSGRRRSAPWRSSRSSSRCGAARTAARWATSTSPATSTSRSRSGPRS